MNTIEARLDLERMTAWNIAPALLSTDVDRLVVLAKRADIAGTEPDTYTEWIASTARALNDLRVPRARNGYVYRVTVAGTSGATEPTWPTTIGATVVDGGVTWIAHATAPWAWTWNLRAAAAEGWRWKAAKIAAEFDVNTGPGEAFLRSQKFAQCIEMARRYTSGQVGTLTVGVA